MKNEKQKICHELLVLLCQQGEKEAFNELIETWEKRLFYYLRRFVEQEHDAWDLLQETWIAVVKSINKLKNPLSLQVWLYRIARNTAYSRFRTEYKKISFNDTLLAENDFSFDSAERFDNAQQVHFALNKLDLPKREVLTLFFMEDFSMQEIAEILDITVGTVKSRLFYARRSLKEVIESEVSRHE